MARPKTLKEQVVPTNVSIYVSQKKRLEKSAEYNLSERVRQMLEEDIKKGAV